MAAVAFLRKDDDVDQMGDASAEPEAEPADPIADLVAEDEVAFIGRSRPATRVLFLLEDLREPGREVLVLLHVANRQLTHLPPPSRWETPIDTPATLMPRPLFPVCEHHHWGHTPCGTPSSESVFALDFFEDNLRVKMQHRVDFGEAR